MQLNYFNLFRGLAAEYVKPSIDVFILQTNASASPIQNMM